MYVQIFNTIEVELLEELDTKLLVFCTQTDRQADSSISPPQTIVLWGYKKVNVYENDRLGQNWRIGFLILNNMCL